MSLLTSFPESDTREFGIHQVMEVRLTFLRFDRQELLPPTKAEAADLEKDINLIQQKGVDHYILAQLRVSAFVS